MGMETLQQAEQLYWQGKYQEALKLLAQLETQNKDTDSERLQRQVLQCRILTMVDMKKAQSLATHILDVSQDLGLPLIRVDALLVLAESWLFPGFALVNINTMADYIYQGKAVLATLSGIPPAERRAREAALLGWESWIYALNGPPERALECAQQSLVLREQEGPPYVIAQALIHLGNAYSRCDIKRAIEVFQQGLTHSEQHEFPLMIAMFLYWLGMMYIEIEELDRALECTQKSVVIFEQLGWIISSLHQLGKVYILKYDLNQALEVWQRSLALYQQLNLPPSFDEYLAHKNIGWVYSLKGEPDLALEHLLQSDVIVEQLGIKVEHYVTLNRISSTYVKQGNLEAALEYALRGLRVSEESGIPYDICYSLLQVITVLVELGQREAARQYEQRLLTLSEHLEGASMEKTRQFAQALVLKVSPRGRDKMQAQVIFQQLAEDDVFYAGYTIQANLHLCELLFFEYQSSEAPEILQEIQMVTSRLLELAQTQQAHSLLAETYFLQAKLALLERDVAQARRLLTQAQGLADDKGLQRLAQQISQEHDELLAQLPQWESLQTQAPALEEVHELSGVEWQLTRMVQQRAPEALELPPEEPILLLILTEGGLTRYAYPFAGGPQLDEHLIGGFITALTSFGQDALTSTGIIDRIMYEDYTVAVKVHTTLMFCYIFQGPSYGALQKLDQFRIRVQEIPDLHRPLTTPTPLEQKSKALGPLDALVEMELEQLIAEIF